MKRHFEELVSDERLEDAESRFRVEVFNATLDIVLASWLRDLPAYAGLWRFQLDPILHTLQCDRPGFVSAGSQAHNDVQR